MIFAFLILVCSYYSIFYCNKINIQEFTYLTLVLVYSFQTPSYKDFFKKRPTLIRLKFLFCAYGLVPVSSECSNDLENHFQFEVFNFIFITFWLRSLILKCSLTLILFYFHQFDIIVIFLIKQLFSSILSFIPAVFLFNVSLCSPAHSRCTLSFYSSLSLILIDFSPGFVCSFLKFDRETALMVPYYFYKSMNDIVMLVYSFMVSQD